MGQALSVQGPEAGPAEWPAPSDAPIPSSLPPYDTSVLSLGFITPSHPPMWWIQGGRLRFPIPDGYSAAASLHGQRAQLRVERRPGETAPRYIVTTEDGSFEGGTPTAPLAKWSLAQGRIDVPGGLDAFGFSHLAVQAALRRMGEPTGLLDTLVAQLQPGVAVRAWAGGAGRSAAPGLLQEIARGVAQEAASKQSQEAAQRTPSTAPSLHTWLSVGEGGIGAVLPPAGASTASPGPAQRSASRQYRASVPEAAAAATAAALPPAAPGRGALARGLPPRPSASPLPPTRALNPTDGASTAEAHAAALVNRPPSRSRRRAASAADSRGSAGRGWTAFTAYGLENRDAIRAEHPWAHAPEIEKILGKRWAALGPQEKQHYADVAAEARRASQGNLAAIAAEHEGGEVQRTFDEAARVAGGAVAGGAAGGSLGAAAGGLQRTRSDAASGDIGRLRARRRQRTFGSDFVTEGAGAGTGAGLAAQQASEDEEEVLGVLQGMRAEVLASESAGKSKEGDGSGGNGEGGGAGVATGPEAEGSSHKIIVATPGEEAHSAKQEQ